MSHLKLTPVSSLETSGLYNPFKSDNVKLFIIII
jgi:hypothetical protein